ncbi:MAG: hypothetical protein ACRDYV_19500, partial [Acidimicrobiia bacterium]
MGPCVTPDPALPGAVELLGDGGRAMVGRFLSNAGLSPASIDAVQVLYRPGRTMTVRFDVKAAPRHGPVEALTIAAECRAGDPVRVWAFPDDPSLPGLRAALSLPGTPGGPDAEMLRYRPRRRAVLRHRLPGAEVLFAKVLPPARARRTIEATGGLCPSACPELRLALPSPGPAPGALL